jgi:wobble nucleotide-excising tRNase
MIQKLKVLKSTGKFYDFASKGDGLDWHKNTFLFAPNAYGKSTLVNVLRSLRDNAPKIIRARRTLNVATVPEAVIMVDGDNLHFNGSKWSKSCPAIRIFDIPFIHANILAQEIEHEHRKSIYLLIIGAQGGELAQELASLKNREKDRRKQFEGLIAKFRSAGFTHALDAFLGVPAAEEAAIAGRIQKLEQDIKSKQSETQVRTLESPRPLLAPAFDLTELKAIAAQKVNAVHKEAERQVLAHIARNFKDKATAKDFIRRGLDLLQSDCPFCGQDLKSAADLLAAYKQYFDDAFRTYQQKLASQLDGLTRWNLDNELTALVSTHNANSVTVKQWEPFIGAMVFPDIATAVESCRPKLAELKAKAQVELEKKQKDPNADIDLLVFDGLAGELASLKTIVSGYNSAVTALIAKTKEFVANLPKSNVDSIQRDLAKQREIGQRFKPEWKQWATDYQKSKKDADDLLSQKNAKQRELEGYTKALFDTHQKRINELLVTLSADFTINGFTGKVDERANEAYSDFSFLILERKVPLTARQEDEPCFKNTLSEGDKSTLAFAFFMAALEKSPDLGNQILIFDDPLSSLDEMRREATARVLMDLSPKLNQLCVFTHKKDFLGMLFDKMPENKVLQIKSDKKNGSRLEPMDVEEGRKGELARLVDEMERYLNEDFRPTPSEMQGNIRKVFEIVLKTKYYRPLIPDIKAKKSFSKLLETLFNKNLLDITLKPTLFNLCNISNDPHHGDLVELPEQKLSRDELLPLIRETFAMLEKI